MSRASASFSLSLELPQLKICELYEVALRDGNTYYYTSHSADLTWRGQTYTALPIVRDAINFNINLEQDTVKVYLAAITGALVDIIQANAIDQAELTIKRIHWSWEDSPGIADHDELIIFKGHADVSFNRDILVLELRPWIDSLNIQTPRRTFQDPCNSMIYDDECGLAQSSFSYTGAATNGNRTMLIDSDRGIVYKAHFTGGDTANTIHKGELVTGGVGAGTAVVVNIMYEDDGTGRLWYCELNGTQFVDTETLLGSGGSSVAVSGSPSENTTLYERGELRIRTGSNAGQRRPILTDQSWTTTAFWPFASIIRAGDSYSLYPGCDGRADETCHSWFGNGTNFSGFLYIPRIEETLL